MEAYDILIGIVSKLDTCFFQSAKAFHREIEKQLRLRGCFVTKEYLVKCRGDSRRGFIDLVVFQPFRAAIELDNVNPRAKSIQKVKSFSGERFVVLRSSKRIIRIS
jgi:hypothetical protein